MMEELSSLIGPIYDCVLAPERWPHAIRAVSERIGCANGVILDLDLIRSEHRFLSTWQVSAEWAARYLEHRDEITVTYRMFSEAPGHPIDEPLLLSRHIPRPAVLASPIYNEWVRPQQLCDFVQTIVLRAPGRLGIFAAGRHELIGPMDDGNISTLRLLAPHIRRAVTISDLMDLRRLSVASMTATLDSLSACIVIVSADRRILHANAAARALLESGNLLRSVRGKLSVLDSAAELELDRAIELARNNEAEVGAAGIGVAITGPEDERAIAHVLPLAHGDIRTRLIPHATAAVFVTRAGDASVIDASVIAVKFGLTPGELRLLERLVTGASLAEAAQALSIALTTARTHLARIFAKTGVARQTDLLALVYRSAPPLRSGG